MLQGCQDQTLSKKCCNSPTKQITTISNTGWRVKQVDHYQLFFTISLGAFYKTRAFKYYRADLMCGACVMWLFY